MKRSSSWRNLQQTFASTPVNTVKRVKRNRKTVDSLQSNHNQTINFRIEDSDEENVQHGNTPRSQLKTPKPVQSKQKPIKPLLINTTLNSSILDSSPAFCSDSGESVDGEQELLDVSEIKSVKRLKTARSKSLLFLSKIEQNNLNSSDERITFEDITSTKQQKPNHKSVFNNTISSRSENDDTIIESDSFDEDESPTDSTKNVIVEKITRQHSADIVFTQTTQSSSDVIESESTQFSLKIESPNLQLNTMRRTRSKKVVKGGLLERLNKVLNSNKSDYSFWMNERTSNLIEPGDKMRIDKIEKSYGRILLHCCNVDGRVDSNIVNILCIDPSFKKLTMLQVAKTIEVGFDSYRYLIKDNTYFYPHVTKILV